jgi:hypothetical protein
VTTLSLSQGKYYEVDKQTSPKSFTAIPGKIDKKGDLIIIQPKNNARNSNYTFTFTLES